MFKSITLRFYSVFSLRSAYFWPFLRVSNAFSRIKYRLTINNVPVAIERTLFYEVGKTYVGRQVEQGQNPAIPSHRLAGELEGRKARRVNPD